MVGKVLVRRDGAMVSLPAPELVPGDVVLLRGGDIVPADCAWASGDVLAVDTAALTGESQVRKVPPAEVRAWPAPASRLPPRSPLLPP